MVWGWMPAEPPCRRGTGRAISGTLSRAAAASGDLAFSCLSPQERATAPQPQCRPLGQGRPADPGVRGHSLRQRGTQPAHGAASGSRPRASLQTQPSLPQAGAPGSCPCPWGLPPLPPGRSHLSSLQPPCPPSTAMKSYCLASFFRL